MKSMKKSLRGLHKHDREKEKEVTFVSLQVCPKLFNKAGARRSSSSRWLNLFVFFSSCKMYGLDIFGLKGKRACPVPPEVGLSLILTGIMSKEGFEGDHTLQANSVCWKLWETWRPLGHAPSVYRSVKVNWRVLRSESRSSSLLSPWRSPRLCIPVCSCRSSVPGKDLLSPANKKWMEMWLNCVFFFLIQCLNYIFYNKFWGNYLYTLKVFCKIIMIVMKSCHTRTKILLIIFYTMLLV